MTVRDSITRTRARTPGAEDYPTSTAAHGRASLPAQCGTTIVGVKAVIDEFNKGDKGFGPANVIAAIGKLPPQLSAVSPSRTESGRPHQRADRAATRRAPRRVAVIRYTSLGLLESVEIGQPRRPAARDSGVEFVSVDNPHTNKLTVGRAVRGRANSSAHRPTLPAQSRSSRAANRLCAPVRGLRPPVLTMRASSCP